jgi:hypothetical protein
MKARIISPFAVSIAAFILSYFFIQEDEGNIGLLFIAVGIILAGFGIYIAVRDHD